MAVLHNLTVIYIYTEVRHTQRIKYWKFIKVEFTAAINR